MQLLQLLYLVLFFSLPITVESFILGPGLNIPSEPLQIIIALVLAFNARKVWISTREHVTNPLYLGIITFIVWQWISCLYSQNAIVSIKYTVIESLHLLVFFVGFLYSEKQYPGLFKQCIVAYTLGMLPVLIRGIYLHAGYDFAIDFSAASMRPFYRDHPLYGAALAILIPLWIYYLKLIRTVKTTNLNKWFTGAVLSILLTALFLSFSRAAWLTCLAGAVICLLVYNFRNSLTKLAIASGILIVIGITTLLVLLNFAQQKQYVKNTTVGNQLVSAFNWKYDVANLERLNRYKCAWRMFKEQPITGFGNNMYKFTYQAYQRKDEMTRISLDDVAEHARAGTGGNSHSDYLAALTELGIIGLVLWLLIVAYSLYLPMYRYIKTNHVLYLFLFFSLFTFYVHSLVNNFMHEDKLAGLVMIITAVLLLPTTTFKETRPTA
jgi:O-antigen ligase